MVMNVDLDWMFFDIDFVFSMIEFGLLGDCFVCI